MTSGARNGLFSAILVAVSLLVSLGAGELLLRVKNSSMTNYDIEMWRYAKDLKARSDDPELDFDHVRSKSAVLQRVMIRLNEWGLRGAPVQRMPEGGRTILFLGGSIALGWGVPEEETVEAVLQDKLTKAGEQVQVLNGGVGNYNAARYVARFFKELAGLEPTDIVVHYFLRDAEALPPGGGNALLRNSQLAVTLWTAYHRLFDTSGEQALADHYRSVYQADAPGVVLMQEKLKQLAEYAREHNVRLFLAMTPDVHNLIDYKLRFVHDMMREIATKNGYTYVDLLPPLAGHPPEDLFAMPGDPHPNAKAHRMMADALFPVVARTGGAGIAAR